jgi:NarL family two-component system sensor histidine kinase LiaS
MANKLSLTKSDLGLRWKLTLSYTAVTVGALLAVEIILLVAAGVVLFALVNSGALPAQLIESASIGYTPVMRGYLSQTPPDIDGLAALLELQEATSVSIPFSFDATERLFIVGPDGQLLAAQPADLFGDDQIGRPLDAHLIPGLAEPLQAAMAGELDPSRLFTLGDRDDPVVLVIPIWDAGHEQLLGVVVGLADYPTVTSILGEALPVLGVSLLILTLVAGLMGALFGYLAARAPVRRLNRLSEATQAWSQGDFSEFVDDPGGDEFGQLARQLNQMARRLEQLLETRRELAVVEERNRLARELHDSVKQQAFAAAAQISGIRALLDQDPAAAAVHLVEAERLIDQLRQELTSLIFELRPAALDGQDLAQAVERYAAQWSRQNEIVSELRLKGRRPLPLEIEQAMFRIIQEALANVARHSLADNVEIALLFNLDHLILEIVDDGQGFGPETQPDGFGLRSMQQRAESLGGQLTIDAAPGRGATLTCNIPIPESNGHIWEKAHG